MRTITQLLKWSERYTRTDMTYLAKGGSWLFLSQALLFLFSFGLLWVFANLTSPELYGQYRFLTTITALLALTTLPGMRTALVRAVARGASGTIPKAIRAQVRWGLLGSLMALLGAGYYFYRDNALLGELFLLIALFVPFYESYAAFEAYHNGRKDYRNLTATTVTRRLIVVLFTTLAIVISQNIFVILCTYLASTTFANIFLWWYTTRQYPPSGEIDREAISYGKQLSLISITTTAADHLDKVVLWYLIGPVQVAMYAVAVSLPREIFGALNQIGILALPKMAEREKTELRKSLLRKITIFFFASLPLLAGYFLAAPLIFRTFLPQYMDTIFYSQIAALLIIFAPLTLFIQYFHATMHTRALYTLQFILPIVLIVLFFIFIPLYGVLGAIYAVIGRQVVSFFLLLYFFMTDTIE